MKQEPKSDDDMEVDSENTTSDRKGASNIVLDGTSEFCRTLGDIPTYGQAGNRADEDDDLLVRLVLIKHVAKLLQYYCIILQDFERELQEERRRIEANELDPSAPGWQQVGGTQDDDTEEPSSNRAGERNVIDDEPMLNAGSYKFMLSCSIPFKLRHSCLILQVWERR